MIKFNRVGYGGGFYDRYIKKINKIKKIITIGVAYSFQKVKKISINKHDMKLDFIITEKALIDAYIIFRRCCRNFWMFKN